MFDLIREYAALHHQFHLPGIGFICLEKSPARADFSDKMFYPPNEEWKLLDNGRNTDDAFIRFIAENKNIPGAQARFQFENFCNGLITAANHSADIKFPGIGIIKKDNSGLWQLETEVRDMQLLKPVIAERVIRKDAEHSILVGDTEKTNIQMNELLHGSEKAANAKWWAWTAALIVFALGLILYSYSKNNWGAAAAGNQRIVTPKAGQ